MTWSKQPHTCELLAMYYQSHIGEYWECDHCKRQWKVIGESGPDRYGVYYAIRYESQIGEHITVRSMTYPKGMGESSGPDL